jgi:hypothetical protein
VCIGRIFGVTEYLRLLFVIYLPYLRFISPLDSDMTVGTSKYCSISKVTCILQTYYQYQ